MGNVSTKRALGLIGSKRCGCSERGVFLDREGNARKKRVHKTTCQFYKKHRHLNRHCAHD